MKSDFVKVIGIDLGRIFLFEFFVSSIVIVVFIEIHDSKKLFFVLWFGANLGLLDPSASID